MNRKTIIYVSVGFLSVCILVALFFLAKKPQRISPVAGVETEKKTLVFKDVKYSGEQKGINDWEIEAAVARKFMDKSIVEMETIKGLYKPKAETTVTFTGSRSSFDTELEKGTMEDVTIIYNTEYTMKSKYMNFDFKKGVTETESPVEITGPKLTIHGIGLTAYTKEQVIRIEKDVSGFGEAAKGRLNFRASRLTYRMKEGLYILEGGVHLTGDKLDVQCATLHIYGKGNQFERLEAKGKVKLTSKKVTARGESAVYYFNEGNVVAGKKPGS